MPPDLAYTVAPLPDGRPCVTVTGRGANAYDGDGLVAAARPYFTTRQSFVIEMTGIGGVKNEYLAYFIGAVARELQDTSGAIAYLQRAVVVRHRPHHHVRFGLEDFIRLEKVPDPPT